MPSEDRELDEFTLKRAKKEVPERKPQPVPVPSKPAVVARTAKKPEILPSVTPVKPPAEFDPQRITKDLQGFLQQPDLFSQYILRIRNRFTKAGEQAFIQHWVDYYIACRKLIEANTGLQRAVTTHNQLNYEDDIQKKKKDVELAKLTAEENEHKLRAAEAQFKIDHMQKSLGATVAGSEGLSAKPTLSEDEKKLDAALHKRRNDIRWKIEHSGEGVTTFVQWQKWRKRQNEEINHDQTLSAAERTEAIQHMNDIYDRAIKQMKQDADIFEER